MSSVSWQRRLEEEEKEVLRRRRRRNHLKEVLEEEEVLRRWSHWKEDELLEEVLRRRSCWKQVLEDEEEVLVTVEFLFYEFDGVERGSCEGPTSCPAEDDEINRTRWF